MKDTAYLVNTARGAVIDEAALVDALRATPSPGAGLDVYEDEPALHPGLLELENVVLAPHIASATITPATPWRPWPPRTSAPSSRATAPPISSTPKSGRADDRRHYRAGILHVEDLPVTALAARYGTPLYVYSSEALEGQYRALEANLRGQARNVLICYALKANANPALGRMLAGWGAGADVVSGGEIYLAQRMGFPPDRIVFAGVGKTRNEIGRGPRRRISAPSTSNPRANSTSSPLSPASRAALPPSPSASTPM